MRHPRRLTAAAGILSAMLAAAASPTLADWRDDVKTLSIGILASGDAAYRRTLVEPFRAYLQEKLGLPVVVVTVGGYSELIDAQAGARIQYAIHSATSFASAVEQCQCVEAVAAPTAAGGALGFYSILLARTGDGIKSLADARGKRIALAGEDSVAGRLIPAKAFADEGIDADTYFSEVVTADSPEAAIAGLLAGEVDLAVGWSSLTGIRGRGYDFGILNRLVAEGRLSMDDVRVVWQSRLIPFGPHAVRSDAPGELKSALRAALTAIAADNPDALDAVDRLSFGGGGFVTPDPELYAVVRELVAPPPAND